MSIEIALYIDVANDTESARSYERRFAKSIAENLGNVLAGIGHVVDTGTAVAPDQFGRHEVLSAPRS